MAYSNYLLVRDKNGNPKFDNWNNIHEGYWSQLTDKDKQYVIKQRGNK